MLSLKSSSSSWLPPPSGCGLHKRSSCFAVCAAKGPRPRSPRVWKTNKRIGTISKSAKFVDCVKGLSNVKEQVYGALDSFIAWELEFPLITVKKALKTLEFEGDWKRVIQVSKWMLSKGQGRTRGTYLTLLSALAEEGRLEEAEELWNKMFRRYMESLPRNFFQKMISIYYRRGMHDKMIEIFADMEELEIKPNVPIVNMMGDVLQKLNMLDKYEKLKNKYPPPKWTIRYIKGKRVRLPAKYSSENNRRLTSTSDDGHAEEAACLSSDEHPLDESTVRGNGDAEDVDEEGSSSSDEDTLDELLEVHDEAHSTLSEDDIESFNHAR